MSATTSDRKPGEFRVGDRVRSVYGDHFDCCAVVTRMKGEMIFGIWRGMFGGQPGYESEAEESVSAASCTLIEPASPALPAREGDVIGSTHGVENRARADSPPAPSDPVEYFRSVLWPEAPPAFPLGQRVEPEVRREKCPTCKGQPLSFEAQHPHECPECSHPSNRAGRGWQEVK